MKTKIITTMLFLGLLLNSFTMEAQYKNTLKLASDAIKYWEQGEKTGNYEPFKKMISPEFNFFSHPLFGISNGIMAKNTFEGVITQREKMPNTLKFTDVIVTASEKDNAIISFTSIGKVMGGQFDYSGYNTIAFGFKNNKIISFREYLGSDDLLKFSKMMASISNENAKATIDTFIKTTLNKNNTNSNSINETISTFDGFALVNGTLELINSDKTSSSKQPYSAVIKKNQDGKLEVISFNKIVTEN